MAQHAVCPSDDPIRSQIAWRTCSVLLCSAVLQPLAAQDAGRGQRERAILSAVIDSLPHLFIGPEREPWSVVLVERRLLPVPLRRRAVTHGLLDTLRHEADWLSEQMARPYVVGSCDDAGIRACDHARSHVVVALARPSFVGDEDATVQLAVKGRSGRDRGPQPNWFAAYSITLRTSDGRWRIAHVEVLGQT